MKKLIVLALFLPSIAYADTAGASLEILPSGTITGGLGGFQGSSSTKTAVGFGVLADHAVDPYISVGFAPRFFFGVNTSNSNNDSAEELDLRLRGTIGKEIVPKVRPYFYFTPGYSVLFVPNGNGGSNHPHGFAIGVGGGVSYDLTNTLSGFVELGYQWGFQDGSFQALGTTTNYEFHTNYFGIALGISTGVKP
jgi:hypothetical protein